MVIFFFAVLALYVLGCAYCGIRYIKPIQSRLWRTVGIVIIALLSLFFFSERLVYQYVPELINRLIYVVGTLWLVFILYSSILFLVFDLARFLARFRGRHHTYSKGTTLIIGMLVALIMGVGYYNATTPVITHYRMLSSKIAQGDTLRLAIVSDLHMGYAVRPDDISKMVTLINNEKADLCIIAGDLLDGDILPVFSNDIGRSIDSIDTRLGTVAILGNHEYMAQVQKAEQYIRTLRLTFLRDSLLTVDNIRIAGRDDASARRNGERTERKPLAEFPADSLFNVVLDHQPGALRESIEAGADLHISGHTHAGQVWPMRFFTRRIFELDYGFCQVDGTQFVVTSGYGTWGPRIRLGSVSEIVVLDVVGEASNN